MTLLELDGDDLTDRPDYGRWQHFDAHGNTMVSSEGQITKETNNAYTVENSTEFLRTYNVANQVGRSVEQYVKNGLQVDTLQVYWDRRGNLSKDHQYEYRYDAFNRLVEVVDNATRRRVCRNYFDTLDRRIVKDITRFVYYQHKIIEERNVAWTKRYFHDDKGVFMMDVRMPGGSRWRRFVHTDRAGNALFLTSQSGRLVEKYFHNPLSGVPTFLDENDEPKTTGSGNPFLFQGMYYDRETGLYLAGPRFYHPRFKMMMQRDPEGIDFDTNAYSYSRNNANSFTDPGGRLHWYMALMIIGAIVGAGGVFVRQLLLYLDGADNPFSLTEILIGALAGAALAPIVWVVPELGLALSVWGGISAVDEFEKGHYLTASFDALMAILGVSWAVRGSSLTRAVMRRRLGPREFDALYPENIPLRERWDMLKLTREQVREQFEFRQGQARAYANQRVARLLTAMDNFARRLGLDPETQVKYVWSEVAYSDLAGSPRVTANWPIPFAYLFRGQPGLSRAEGIYINLDYFLPLRIRTIYRPGRGLPTGYHEARARYRYIKGIIAHEAGHFLFGAGHGGGVYNDASSVSILQLGIRRNVLRRSEILQIARTAYQGPAQPG